MILLISSNALMCLVTKLTIRNTVKIVNRFTGHAKKVLEAVTKAALAKSPKTPAIATSCMTKTSHNVVDLNNQINDVTDTNSLYNTIPGVPVFVYNASKIKNQLKENYVVKKHLSLYEKNGLQMPFVVETFPNRGISGSFTLAPVQRELLEKCEPSFANSIAFAMVRYAIIMYAGSPIKTISDILVRRQDLFSQDDSVYKFSYPLNHVHGIQSFFPLTQHFLALDTYGLKIPVENIIYPSNFSLTTKTITFQRDLEIFSISKSHDFVTDMIIIIDINNSNHHFLLKKYSHIMNTISKQPEVDAVGSHTVFGTNEKVYYPIDTKIISHPEKNLDMLSSYSSISPKYNVLETVQKMHGQIHNLNTTIQSKDLERYLSELDMFKNDFKKEKISDTILKQKYDEWVKMFFHKQLQNNKFIYDKHTTLDSGDIVVTKKSTLPSIITNANKLSGKHHYSIMKETNPQIIDNMRQDIVDNMKLYEYFPTMDSYKKYDVYTTQLAFMIFLKKYGMIDNYYAYRKLLPLQDVHDC